MVWLITIQLTSLNNSQTIIDAMPAGHGKHLAHSWCSRCVHTVSRSWCYHILWAASECLWCWNSALVSSSLAFFIWPPPWHIMSHWLASGLLPFPPVPIPCNDFAMWCNLPSWRQRQLICLICQYTSTRLHGLSSSKAKVFKSNVPSPGSSFVRKYEDDGFVAYHLPLAWDSQMPFCLS